MKTEASLHRSNKAHSEKRAVLSDRKRILSELKRHIGKQSNFCDAHSLKRALNEERRLMNCPYCVATSTKKRTKKTKLGYTTSFCPNSRCTFNERIATPFNYLEFPTDIVLLAVLWRLRYKLRLRDRAELFLARGFAFTHEAIRDWEMRFAPLIAEQLRSKRHGQAGKSWYVDETYMKVHGKWCYLYRALDQDGNLVDSMLSREAEYGGSQALFQAGCCRCWPCSRSDHNRWAYFLSAGHTRDDGQQRRASDQ